VEDGPIDVSGARADRPRAPFRGDDDRGPRSIEELGQADARVLRRLGPDLPAASCGTFRSADAECGMRATRRGSGTLPSGGRRRRGRPADRELVESRRRVNAYRNGDIVETAAEAERLAKPPLLVLDRLRAFLDERGLGSGSLRARRIGEGGGSNFTFLLERDVG